MYRTCQLCYFAFSEVALNLKEEIKESKKSCRDVAVPWFPYHSGNGLTIMKHLPVSSMSNSFFRTDEESSDNRTH